MLATPSSSITLLDSPEADVFEAVDNLPAFEFFEFRETGFISPFAPTLSFISGRPFPFSYYSFTWARDLFNTAVFPFGTLLVLEV